MTKVYGVPNCNTVKKAIDWLNEHQLPFEFYNYKKKAITAAKLQEWSKQFGWENLVNKAGTTYKKLQCEEKATITNETAAIELMIRQNSVIKRPIEESGTKRLKGFNEEEYAEMLLKK